MSELFETTENGLVNALVQLGALATISDNNDGPYGHASSKVYFISTHMYNPDLSTFCEVAESLLGVFVDHELNRLWITALDPNSNVVRFRAIVDGKDWSLFGRNGWDMGVEFTPYPEPIVPKNIDHLSTGEKSRIADFKNESNNDFIDISKEANRTYNFGQKGFVKVNNPVYLSVSSSGGHRIFDASGQSHYIPNGWIHLSWVVREGEPNFVA